MTQERVIDKVTKLLALASSPVMEEARSAAYMAAQLIRDHQLQVVDPTEKPVRRKVDVKVDGVKQDPYDGFVITSRYAGRCKGCGKSYHEGDRVFWKKGVGAWHARCKFEEPF